jgi:hypothetical protein
MLRELCSSLKRRYQAREVWWDHGGRSRGNPFNAYQRMGQLIPEPSAPLYVSEASLSWALEHAEQFGDTVFLPASFEYEAIRHSWDSIRNWLAAQDMVKWSPRPWRRLLAPKSHYSFRYVTQLDPLEYLAFTALLYEVGPKLEAMRIPSSTDTIVSWRFAIGAKGQMYDPAYEWVRFTQRCRELARADRVRSVVIADVADFFPRIYIHPVERAIAEATGASPHAYCLLRHIRNWNAFVSYGLPVGVSGSRIIAEATLNDVDRGLTSKPWTYCRYADDIRIFCADEGEARRALELLARMLFENHGHTLHSGKTDILAVEDYLDRFDISADRLEAESLTARFHDLMEEAGFGDDYHSERDYEDLSPEIQEQIDGLNLVAVFNEQLEMERSDPVVMKILLHRMGQLNIDDIVDDLLASIGELTHVMEAVVKYLAALRRIDASRRRSIGERILDALDLPFIGTYERYCLASLFTRSREFNQEGKFEALLDRYSERAIQRELILAMGRAGQQHWFITNRRDLQELDPWTRRAFIAAFSCVSKDARVPFYRSMRGGADLLETAIIDWVQANPFH